MVVFEAEAEAGGVGALVGPVLDVAGRDVSVAEVPLESSPALSGPPKHPGSPAARTRLTTTASDRIAVPSDFVPQKGTDLGLGLRMVFLGQGWKAKRRWAVWVLGQRVYQSLLEAGTRAEDNGGADPSAV